MQKHFNLYPLLLLLLIAGCTRKPEVDPPVSSQAAPQLMSPNLQERAKAYLERPIPEGMPYAADNLTDGLIARYAAEGKIAPDPEAMDLMQICILEAEDAAAAPDRPPEQQKVFRESAEILHAIMAETQSRR